MMTRREARELAFTLLYQMSFNREKSAEQIYLQELVERGFEDNEYVKRVVMGVSEHLEELDTLIEENSNGWKVKRISRISLALMELSIYEMLYEGEIPFNVSINEAVELSKKFDDEKAPAFINGILNTVAEKKGIKK